MTTIDKFLKNAGKFFILAAVIANAHGAITDIAQAPLVTSSSSTQNVRPNVFLMMDDSGSMGWDYLPDEAGNFNGKYGYTSSQCNGVYYDPNMTHTAPLKADGSSFLDATFTAAWKDGYNTGNGTTNLNTGFSSGGSPTGSAFYYTYSGSQTTYALKNYANTSSTFYKECNSSIGSAPGNAVFTKHRLATTETTTITVSGISSTSVSGITVNTKQIMSAASGTATTSSSTLASNIASKINLCTAAISGSCTVTGYSAIVSGSTVTITGPTTAADFTPVITQSGSMTLTTDVFPITVASKLTNFANWYSYYSFRINMMKTATGQAFRNITANYRVGFATMNNNGGTDLINLAPFVDSTSPVSTQRTDFYAKLYATSPGSSTPLLEALSNAGLMYAHKLPGNKLNTVAANDPIEYSCQQNFTILSTDGYWNNATNMTLAANTTAGNTCSTTTGPSTTAVGNCDGTEVRPMKDGASLTTKTATTTTTVDEKQTVTNQTTTKTWNRTYKFTAATKGTGGCGVNKYLVTTQAQTYNELIGSTKTSVDDYTSTSTSTVTCTNGLCGAPVVTTAGPTASNVSSSTVTNSDTGAPTGSTTWTVASTSTACSSSPTPAAGTSSSTTPTLASTSTATVGTPVVTLLSSSTTTGAPVVTTTTSGGTSNTLADVAEYYYITDMRDASLSNTTGSLGTDVTKNNVPTSGSDAASWQHMTTFTLGLGARGKMVFSPTYQTDGSGDFFAVKNGSLATGGICSWQNDGKACNWPSPPAGGGDATTIDDLWHAAVDGRGAYYSATDPASLSTGLATALAGVSARTGTSASASISNPNISTGDNYIFSSNFVTQDWYGRLIRQQLDLNTGALLPTIDWEAGAQLATNTARNIYAYSSSSSNHLQAFNATNFGGNANFATANISSLTQFCTVGPSCLTATQITDATGAKLVSYLTGDRTYEGYPTDPSKYYRQRINLLGDIVDSQAAYVKSPLLLYNDPGYAAFVTAKANRQSMIYVGANDGMLHAFYANTDLMDNVSGDVVTTGGVSVTGGQEAWAFVPTAVMPNLYKLADINYASLHRYFVDGSPVSSDICPTTPALDCDATTWKTILVGGLNAGGNSFFAMDVTNPAAPIALWEFTNPNLGYSYGNPQIVKLGGAGTGALAAGTWVVLLTSGYNNADGQGHLFVLNAYTGALLLDVATGVGSATNPSGLSKIIAQVVNPSFDATVLQVYGGDLFGNVWRFDVNGNVGATGNDAQLLAVLTGPTGVAQPITTKPEVGLVNGKVVVYVGTGRYLGISDINGSTTDQKSPNLQTMYAIMDPLLAGTTPNVAIYSNPRTLTTNAFVQQLEYDTVCPSGAPSTVCTYGQIIRTSTNYPVNIPTNSGWYVDFPDSGELLNTDPALELGMLAFNTNVPNASSCSIGGDSWNWLLDYTSGSFLSNSTVIVSAAFAATLPPGMAIANADGTFSMGVSAQQHTGSESTAPVPISLPNGNKAICTNDSTGQLICRLVNAPPPPGGARRVSWRDLQTQ